MSEIFSILNFRCSYLGLRTQREHTLVLHISRASAEVESGGEAEETESLSITCKVLLATHWLFQSLL